MCGSTVEKIPLTAWRLSVEAARCGAARKQQCQARWRAGCRLCTRPSEPGRLQNTAWILPSAPTRSLDPCEMQTRTLITSTYYPPFVQQQTRAHSRLEPERRFGRQSADRKEIINISTTLHPPPLVLAPFHIGNAAFPFFFRGKWGPGPVTVGSPAYSANDRRLILL